MKILKLLAAIVTIGVIPAAGFTSDFVILTPDADHRHDELQPWLYYVETAPEIVTVVIPFHKGGKKYWLVTAARPLPDEQLNFRNLIWLSHNPLPDYITSIVPLSPHLDNVGQPEKAGFITFLVRKEDLAKHYVYNDFATGVDDGGDYRTYKLSSYKVTKQFEGTRIREMEASSAMREKEVEELLRNAESSKKLMEEWYRQDKEKKANKAEMATPRKPSD